MTRNKKKRRKKGEKKRRKKGEKKRRKKDPKKRPKKKNQKKGSTLMLCSHASTKLRSRGWMERGGVGVGGRGGDNTVVMLIPS